MSSKIKNESNKRYSVDEITIILDEYENGGYTLKDFCSKYGISDATFYNWRKRYLNRKVSCPGDFIEVIPVNDTAEVPADTGKLFAEVRGISFYQPVSAAYLKALIS